MATATKLGLYGGPTAGALADTSGKVAATFTGALEIDGTTIPVIHGGHSERTRPFKQGKRGTAGEYVSPRTYAPGRNKTTVWEIEVPSLLLADIQPIEDALKTAGQKTADGYLVGGDPVQVYVEGLEPVWGDTTLEYGLRFRLVKAVP